MHSNKNDDLFKKIANEYVEHYGTELQRELDDLRQMPNATASEMRVQKHVRKRIATQKRMRYIPVISTLAACFVIALIFMLPNFPGENISFAPDSAPDEFPGAMEPLPAPDPAPAPPPDSEAPAPPPPSTAEPLPPTEDSFDEAEPPMYEIIPLPAPLPDGFVQVGFEQDFETSIYFIEDIYQNIIVVTLEIADMPSDLYEMEEINIDGNTVFGRQTDTYSLLMFMRDDVLYTLTSEHDISMLLKLANAFI